MGRKAYLIDTVAEVNDLWFTGDETVLVTAGPVLPRSSKCVATLKNASTGRREPDGTGGACQFPLPRELRLSDTDDCREYAVLTAGHTPGQSAGARLLPRPPRQRRLTRASASFSPRQPRGEAQRHSSGTSAGA